MLTIIWINFHINYKIIVSNRESDFTSTRVKVMDESYKSLWHRHMMADSCWFLIKDRQLENYKRNTHKKRWFIENKICFRHFSALLILILLKNKTRYFK